MHCRVNRAADEDTRTGANKRHTQFATERKSADRSTVLRVERRVFLFWRPREESHFVLCCCLLFLHTGNGHLTKAPFLANCKLQCKLRQHHSLTFSIEFLLIKLIVVTTIRRRIAWKPDSYHH